MAHAKVSGAAAIVAVIFIFLVVYSFGYCVGRRHAPGSTSMILLSILAFFVFLFVLWIIASVLG